MSLLVKLDLWEKRDTLSLVRGFGGGMSLHNSVAAPVTKGLGG